MKMTAPATITDQVLRFVHSRVSETAVPQMVPVTPGSGCMPSDCFANVQKMVDREGGRIQFGWALWEWPGVYFEAEHHAVHVPADSSSFKDITPCAEGNRYRLFVSDDTAIWDFENEGVLRDNLRFALIDDPLIDDLFKAAARRVAFMNELPGVGMISIHASDDKILQKLELRVARASDALTQKYDPAYRRP